MTGRAAAAGRGRIPAVQHLCVPSVASAREVCACWALALATQPVLKNRRQCALGDIWASQPVLAPGLVSEFCLHYFRS